MATLDAQKIKHASSQHPKPSSFTPAYGTAGFRAKAELLDSTVFRCGLLTAARSAVLGGRCCGLMVTASHNPAPDNGVKIVEADGAMLDSHWEPLATQLACADSDEAVAQIIAQILQQQNTGHDSTATTSSSSTSTSSSSSSSTGVVLLGYDTRPSAPALVAAAKEGVLAMGATLLELGCVTTPQLHFNVAAANAGKLSSSGDPKQAAASLPQQATSLGLYFNTLLGGYAELAAYAAANSQTCSTSATDASNTSNGGSSSSSVHVDCANGVGAQQFKVVAERLSAAGSAGSSGSSGALQLQLINTGSSSSSGLNAGCGADYVQKEKVAPVGFNGLPHTARCCSIDGDADRLVYFILEPEQQQQQEAISSGTTTTTTTTTTGSTQRRSVRLLDGDRIAALAALTVKQLLDALPAGALQPPPKVGVVQTAYANGASTHYLANQLGLEVVCTKTGVKHLHPVAHSYDVGIYWEANGHGTVLFSSQLLAQLHKLHSSSSGDAQPAAAAAGALLALSRCVNQAVGDALSGLLLVEAALRLQGWAISDWEAMYADLPSRQTKLTVQDRSVVVCADPAERRVCSPPGLQAAIDAAVQQEQGLQARAFVRASGTEDAVRVYAEADTQAAADRLALRVAQAVYDLAGGVGPRPG